MNCIVNANYPFKGIDCVKLETKKYFAVISPEVGCSVLRLYDKINGIDVFRYSEKCSIDHIKNAREIWGLPTLYLPNRFDRGMLKTSDNMYTFPINETLLDNYIHGFVHQRVHTVEETFSNVHTAILKTSFTFNVNDEMYKYFPVDFKINYDFTLSDGNGLVQTICLENYSENKLPVSICTHTCLSAPMTANGKEENMRLSVPIVKKCQLDDRCLPTEKLMPLDDWDLEYKNATKLPTLQTISNDMYTACMNKLDNEDFYGVVIEDLDTGKKICNEVSKEFKFWNMWNDSGDKGYFCPEPMTAMINAPNLSLPSNTTGYSELDKNQKYVCWQRFFTQ